MRVPAAGLQTVVLLLAAMGVAAAQQEPGSMPAPPAGEIPSGAGVPADRSNPPEAVTPSTDEEAPAGAAQRGVAPAPVPPARETPRAHVSIVSPSQSTVHKRQHGSRPQDGAGITDGGAQDVPAGPTVERLE